MKYFTFTVAFVALLLCSYRNGKADLLANFHTLAHLKNRQ